MVDIRNGRTASINQGGEGGKTIGFTDDDMILTLGSNYKEEKKSSGALNIAEGGQIWQGGNGAFNAGGGGGGIYGGGE